MFDTNKPMTDEQFATMSPDDRLNWNVQFCIDTASGSLSSTKLTPTELVELKRGLETFVHSIKEIRNLLLRLDSWDHEHFTSNLNGALISAFVIGSRGSISESSGKFHQSTRQAEAGRKSGTRRKEKRLWLKEFDELAVDIRSRHPRLSQDDLSADIDQAWRSVKPKCPGHETRIKRIRELEKNKTLKKRSPVKQST